MKKINQFSILLIACLTASVSGSAFIPCIIQKKAVTAD